MFVNSLCSALGFGFRNFQNKKGFQAISWSASPEAVESQRPLSSLNGGKRKGIYSKENS